MNFLKKHKSISVVIVLILAFVAHTLLTGEEEEALLVEPVRGGVSEAAMIEGDLLTLLADLRSLTLDDSIFTSETFQHLINFGKELVPQPVSRPNPFAPIGVGEVVVPNDGGDDEEGV